MMRKRYPISFALALLLCLAGSNLPSARGARATGPLKSVLYPGWVTGVINISVGAGGIVVADLNQDGVYWRLRKRSGICR